MEEVANSLPVPTLIDFGGKPKSLRIERLLSDAGYTSMVYEGWLSGDQPGEEFHVAIKMMKPLDIAQDQAQTQAQALFDKEAITLASLGMYFKKQEEEASTPPPHISPIYYGKEKYQGVPFLVMEFVEGKPVAELLQEAESGRLPEAQALTIIWQLFFLLDVLHTRLKKTFVDLKFENLWWVEKTPGQGQLKVLDFGTLEDIKPSESVMDGKKRDLLLAGVYFCYLITGQQPAYSTMGYLRNYREADEIIRRGEMSWGTREWLYRLLHRNSKKRPTSAKEIAAALRELADYWTQPLPMLLKGARGSLKRLEKKAENAKAENTRLLPEDVRKARRVRAVLAIAARRDPQDETIREDIERIDSVLNLNDFVRLGKMALRGRAFELARQRFEEGMQWRDPAPLRRWAYLARVGEDVFSSVFDEHQESAFQMVEWFNEGDWKHGLERLEQLRPDLESSGLEMLYNDAQLFKKLKESADAKNDGLYEQAAQALREALKWLEKLPDKDFIVREEIGDLDSQVRELENLASTVEQATRGMQEVSELLQQPQPPWDEVVTKARKAFDLDPRNPARLKDLQQLAEKAIEHNAYCRAQQIAEIALRFAPLPKEYRQVLYLSRDLCRAEAALTAGGWETFRSTLRRIHTKKYTNLQVQSALTYLRNQAAPQAEAEAKDDSSPLKALLALAEAQGDNNWAKELKQKIKVLDEQRKKRLQELVDRLILEIELLQFDEPENAQFDDLLARFTLSKISTWYQQEEKRLEDVQRKIQDAARIAREINYRQADVDNIEKRVKEKLQEVQENKRQRDAQIESERQSRLKEIQQLWKDLQRFAEWAKEAPQKGVDVSIPVQQAINRHIQTQANELILRGKDYLTSIDADDASVQEILEKASVFLDPLGKQGWEALRNEAEEHIRRIQQRFEQARQAFENGGLQRAATELDTLAPDYGQSSEWGDLKEKIIQAVRLKELYRTRIEKTPFDAVDDELLKRIRDEVSLGLPAVYYKPVYHVVQNWRQDVDRQWAAQRQEVDRQEFLPLLRRWMDIELTRRMIERVIGKG